MGNIGWTNGRHEHAEAFMLMVYVSDDGHTGELIYNSRDGVTPFVVTSRDGVEMTHTNWSSDIYAPAFHPPPGMRMFVDMTEEMAYEAAMANVERWWDHPEIPMRGRWLTKEDAAKALAQDYVGGPTIVEAPPHPVRPKGPFDSSKFGF